MTDHEVALLMELLDERETLIRESGKTPMQIFGLLKDRGLSFAQLALKFEVNKSCIAKIANGERRCQTPAEIKECP